MRCRYQRLPLVCGMMLMLFGLSITPAHAEADRSYKAVREWLEKYRDAKPDFKPGEHLTIQGH